jgi:hypothetical protein
MSAATAQVFGLIIVALALTLAATKLVADYMTGGGKGGAKAGKKPADEKGGKADTAARPGFLRRARQHASPRPWRPASRSQVTEKLPENTV